MAAQEIAEHAMQPESAAFDREALLEVLGGDELVLVELIQLYLQEAPRLHAAIRRAAVAAQPQELRLAAHALKGTLANFAAPAAHAAAEALEVLARSGDFTRVPAALARLDAELERLHVELTPSAPPEV
jgi:two-component system, sensor histidine kinase and response regulator